MTEIQELEKAVDLFAKEMKAKLRLKDKEGYRGGLEFKNRGNIARKLVNHLHIPVLVEDARILEGCWNQTVDIANLAMMLWESGRRFQEENKQEASND